MDALDWDTAEVVMNNSASWENPQESSMMPSISGGFAIIGGKLGIPQDIFNSIQLLQRNNNKVGQMFQHSASPAFDQIQATSSWNFSQQADHDAVPGKLSGAEICSCPGLNKNDFMMNQLNGLDSTDYGMANNSSTGNTFQEVTAGITKTRTTGGSVESLDCLLSASNSNTDTSVEDDHEISMIFSDYKTLWNFKPMNAVSSGESACDSSNARDHNNHHSLINEVDETASQTSSDPSGTRHKSNKRSRETLLKTGQNDQHFDLVRTDINSTPEGSFKIISEIPPKSKKPRTENRSTSSNTISFQLPGSSTVSSGGGEPDSEAIAQMKEMIYRAAAFRPVNFGTELMEKPKRKNVRISSDPQTVAARQRRERISERIRVLQRLVPGGSKMDTASMLDEAANYLTFLRSQVKALEAIGQKGTNELVNFSSIPFNHSFPVTSQFPLHTSNYVYHHPKI